MNFTIFFYLFFQRNQFCHKTASFELIHETFTFWCIYQRRLSKQNLLFVVGNTFSLCLQSWAKIHAVFDSAFNYVVYTVNFTVLCKKQITIVAFKWLICIFFMNEFLYLHQIQFLLQCPLAKPSLPFSLYILLKDSIYYTHKQDDSQATDKWVLSTFPLIENLSVLLSFSITYSSIWSKYDSWLS